MKEWEWPWIYICAISDVSGTDGAGRGQDGAGPPARGPPPPQRLCEECYPSLIHLYAHSFLSFLFPSLPSFSLFPYQPLWWWLDLAQQRFEVTPKASQIDENCVFFFLFLFFFPPLLWHGRHGTRGWNPIILFFAWGIGKVIYRERIWHPWK